MTRNFNEKIRKKKEIKIRKAIRVGYMIIKQVEYNPIPDQDYKLLLKQRAIKSIQYRMNKLKITSNELSMS